jgi:hypothetical protein
MQGQGGSRMLFDSDDFIGGISRLEDEKSIIYASNKDKCKQLYQYNKKFFAYILMIHNRKLTPKHMSQFDMCFRTFTGSIFTVILY